MQQKQNLDLLKTDQNKNCKNITNNHRSFLPFILETSGSILPNSFKILKDTARIGAERHQIPYNIYYNFIINEKTILFNSKVIQ